MYYQSLVATLITVNLQTNVITVMQVKLILAIIIRSITYNA